MTIQLLYERQILNDKFRLRELITRIAELPFFKTSLLSIYLSINTQITISAMDPRIFDYLMFNQGIKYFRMRSKKIFGLDYRYSNFYEEYIAAWKFSYSLFPNAITNVIKLNITKVFIFISFILNENNGKSFVSMNTSDSDNIKKMFVSHCIRFFDDIFIGDKNSENYCGNNGKEINIENFVKESENKLQDESNQNLDSVRKIITNCKKVDEFEGKYLQFLRFVNTIYFDINDTNPHNEIDEIDIESASTNLILNSLLNVIKSSIIKCIANYSIEQEDIILISLLSTKVSFRNGNLFSPFYSELINNQLIPNIIKDPFKSNFINVNYTLEPIDLKTINRNGDNIVSENFDLLKWISEPYIEDYQFESLEDN